MNGDERREENEERYEIAIEAGLIYCTADIEAVLLSHGRDARE